MTDFRGFLPDSVTHMDNGHGKRILLCTVSELCYLWSMKTILILLCFAVSAFADTLPPDAAALKGKRDAKVAEINRLYARELDKIQKRALRDGDMKGAEAIAKEIAEAEPNPFLSGEKAVSAKLRNSQWKHEETGRILTFHEDGTASKSWGKLRPTWEVRNETIYVEDSKFIISTAGDQMTSQGRDKEGVWVKQG